jgi:GLPGLI family protein
MTIFKPGFRDLKRWILFFLCPFLYGQVLQVNYNTVILDETPKWGDVQAYQILLYTNGLQSIEYKVPIDTVLTAQSGMIHEIYKSDKKNGIRVSGMKDLSAKIYTGYEHFYQFQTIDALDIKFTHTQRSKMILGYDCQEILFYFRGRHYKAYFASDLKHRDGPYKFIGASGMILEVKSLDGAVHIKAVGIHESSVLLADKIKIDQNTEYKQLTYDQYEKLILEYWYRIISKLESEYENSESSFNSRRIEVMNNKLDENIQ